MLVYFAYLDLLVGLRIREGQQESMITFRQAKVRPYADYDITLSLADSIWTNRVVRAA